MEGIQRKRKSILGFGVDLYSFDEALQIVLDNLRKNIGMQIVTINPEMISTARKNTDFGNILNAADLVIPDGVGVKLALKIKGINQENIPGIEFAKKLIALSSTEGYTIGLLGAKEEVIQKAAQNLRNEHNNLNITYIRNGYFSPEEENIVTQELTAMAPNIVLVALGAPKQEILIQKLRKTLPQSVFIGVGGSFDVWSGMIKRSPKIWQKLGLEWLYRTVKEPKRFKRIFPTLPLFVIQVIMESIREMLVK